MFTALQNPLSLIGRLLMAWVFLPQGIAKITGYAGMVGYAGSMGLPLPELGIAVAIAVEILGGLALIAGFGTRWAAIVLAVFTLAASFVFHAYWSLPVDKQMIQSLLFYKNIGLVGGLLILAAFGAGGWSLDAKRQQD